MNLQNPDRNQLLKADSQTSGECSWTECLRNKHPVYPDQLKNKHSKLLTIVKKSTLSICCEKERQKYFSNLGSQEVEEEGGINGRMEFPSIHS